MPDPFVTAQDLTDHLGRDVTADAGAVIALDFACDVVRDYTGQAFNAGTTTEYFNGTGTDALVLRNLPANTVGTVEVRDSDGTWTTLGTADWSLDEAGVIYALDTAGTSTLGTAWPKGRRNVRISYSHGYADADLPRSVRGIALAIAERFLIQGPALFESIGDVNVRYAAESTCVMPTERLILRGYRR